MEGSIKDSPILKGWLTPAKSFWLAGFIIGNRNCEVYQLRNLPTEALQPSKVFKTIKQRRNFLRKICQYFRELGRLTPIAIVTTLLPILGSAVLILFAQPLGNWLRENWEIGTPLYFLGILLFCGFALLPTNIVGVLAGWTFSFDLGIAVLITGIVGAALFSFLIHSRLVGDGLPHVLETHPKAKAIYQALVGQSMWRAALIISLLRLSPAMPFALTNFLMAAARVPMKSFVIGTFVGMLPRSSAVVFLGAGLSELTFDNQQNTGLIIFGIAATIIVVVVIGTISKHALERLYVRET